MSFLFTSLFLYCRRNEERGVLNIDILTRSHQQQHHDNTNRRNAQFLPYVDSI